MGRTDNINGDINAFTGLYDSARRLFVQTAAIAGALHESHICPASGPDGSILSTDVAWLGPPDAEAVLVILSGTHGVEGVCGSGAQISWLQREEYKRYPSDVGILLIHAINPFGFAWTRRVNEDNVDLNRNWIDFSDRPSTNPDYIALRDAICPADWLEGLSSVREDPVLAEFSKQRGFAALQSAISGGQWSDPDGVFYGGDKPTWSRTLQTDIFNRYLRGRRRVAILDIHTGLGPSGVVERILTTPEIHPANKLAEAWLGKGLASPINGNSSSAVIHGDGLSHALNANYAPEIIGVALEYGTVTIEDMLDAVRADNWLHCYGKSDTPNYNSIKATLLQAFYTDNDFWRGMIVGQFLLSAFQAANALTSRWS